MAKDKKRVKAKAYKPSKERIEKHLARLQKVAEKNGGVLPTFSWLNTHGFFDSYKIVAKYVGFSKFKREKREGKAKTAKAKTATKKAAKSKTNGHTKSAKARTKKAAPGLVAVAAEPQEATA